MNDRATIEKLEQEIKDLRDRRLDDIENTLKQVVENQHEMEKQLERYSARWGLILMVGSAVLAALKFFWEDLTKFLK